MRFGLMGGGLKNNLLCDGTEPALGDSLIDEGSQVPLVCIVIPAYQAATTIAIAISSAINQRNVRVHLIIVDHGSRDNTREVAAIALAGQAATIVELERHWNERPSAARPLNVGFYHALYGIDSRCDWVMRLDADDFLASDTALASLCKAANETGKLHHCTPELVCGKLVFFDAELMTAERFSPRAGYLSRSVLLAGAAYSIPHHSLLYAPQLLTRVMGLRGHWFDPAISYGEDLDLTAAVIAAAKEGQILFIDHDLIYKRLDGPTQTRTLRRIRIGVDHFRVFRKHTTFRKYLLVRAWIDLLLQQLGWHQARIRDLLGYPGKVYGEIAQTSFIQVQTRLNELTAKIGIPPASEQ